MDQDQLITCFNCSCLVKQDGKLCYGCGADNAIETVVVHTEPSPSKTTTYVYNANRRVVELGSNDDDDSDRIEYAFPEVQIAPPTLDSLFQTYTSTLEELRALGCLYYSIMYDPRTRENDIKYAGIPDETAENAKALIKIHFPMPSKKTRKKKALTTAQILERPYACEEPGCDYRTKYSWQVKNHMRQHTGEKPYACTRCNFRGCDSSSLLKHTRAHDLVTPHRCSICDLGFVKQRGLVYHMSFAHGVTDESTTNLKATKKPDGQYTCDVCGKVSVNKRTHLSHKVIHSLKRPFPCPKCAYRAKQKSSLVFHMKSHETMDSKELGCDKCSFRTDFYNVLAHHNKLFHFNPAGQVGNGSDAESVVNTKRRAVPRTGPWTCPTCNTELQTRFLLIKHRKENHGSQIANRPHPKFKIFDEGENNKTYSCNKCRFSAKDEASITNHCNTHEFRKYSCGLCPFKSSARTVISKHKTRVHGILLPNKCTKCDFAAEMYSQLMEHMKNDHFSTVEPVEQIPMKCFQCPFTTNILQDMKAHQNFHDGISFYCSLCGYTGYDRVAFTLHKRTHEQGGGDSLAGKRKITGGKRKSSKLLKLNTQEPSNHILIPISAPKFKSFHSLLKPSSVNDSVKILLKSLDSKSLSVTKTDSAERAEKPSMPKLTSLLSFQTKKPASENVNNGAEEPTEPQIESGVSQADGVFQESTSIVQVTRKKVPSTTGSTQTGKNGRPSLLKAGLTVKETTEIDGKKVFVVKGANRGSSGTNIKPKKSSVKINQEMITLMNLTKAVATKIKMPQKAVLLIKKIDNNAAPVIKEVPVSITIVDPAPVTKVVPVSTSKKIAGKTDGKTVGDMEDKTAEMTEDKRVDKAAAPPLEGEVRVVSAPYPGLPLFSVTVSEADT